MLWETKSHLTILTISPHGSFYLRHIYGKHIHSAFVTTNSSCQGEQVSLLWDYIYRHTDIEIYFGYKSFKWGDNAKNVQL